LNGASRRSIVRSRGNAAAIRIERSAIERIAAVKAGQDDGTAPLPTMRGEDPHEDGEGLSVLRSEAVQGHEGPDRLERHREEKVVCE